MKRLLFSIMIIYSVIETNAQSDSIYIPSSSPIDSFSITVYVGDSSSANIRIFNRWGSIVSQAITPILYQDSITQFFDFSGMNQEVYYWMVQFDDTSRFVGYITVNATQVLYSYNTNSILEKRNNEIKIISYYNTIVIEGTRRGTATIYNLTGQQVHHAKITGNTTISLDGGIYLVRVISEGRRVTKKVYLN